MGMYSETIKCDLSYKYVYRTAANHGLPLPRETGDGHAMYFTCNDVKAWDDYCVRCDLMGVDVNRDVFHITLLLQTHALAYINKVGRGAPQEPARKRLKYFQRASKKYRLNFF